MRDMRVCFSGHRKVEGRYPPSLKWKEIFSTVVGICQHLANTWGAVEFISGGALGFDTVAAQAVIWMKNHGYRGRVTLTMALPFPGYNKVWPHGSIAEIESICNYGADKVLYVTQQTAYDPRLLQIRNIWMKDNSDTAIILWDGSKGGTSNFRYAHICDRRRIPHIWIKPATMEVVWFAHDPNNQERLLSTPFK